MHGFQHLLQDLRLDIKPQALVLSLKGIIERKKKTKKKYEQKY